MIGVLLLALLAACGGSSYRCVCQDGRMRSVEMSNRGTPPAALPARSGAELCRDTCDNVPTP